MAGVVPGASRLLYAGEIAVNHCAPDAQRSELLDAGSTSAEPITRYPHIHCWAYGGDVLEASVHGRGLHPRRCPRPRHDHHPGLLPGLVVAIPRGVRPDSPKNAGAAADSPTSPPPWSP